MCTFSPQEIGQRYPGTRCTWGDHRAGLASRWLTEAGLPHAFSLPPANMSTAVGPQPDADQARRREMCRALGGDPECLFLVRQVHGSGVARVDAGSPPPGEADALMTDDPAVTLLTLSADCPLVLVWEPQVRCWGMAHAGWRGLVGGVVCQLVAEMTASYTAEPERMLAAISPCAGPQCYEVGGDVAQAAEQAMPEHERLFDYRGKSMYFDLWAAAISELQRAGLKSENIDLAWRCTMADGRFYSHRRQGAQAGRSALMATAPIR